VGRSTAGVDAGAAGVAGRAGADDEGSEDDADALFSDAGAADDSDADAEDESEEEDGELPTVAARSAASADVGADDADGWSGFEDAEDDDAGERSDRDVSSGSPSRVQPSPVAGTSSRPVPDVELRVSALLEPSSYFAMGAVSAIATSTRPSSVTGTTRVRRMVTATMASGAIRPAARNRARARSPVTLAANEGPEGVWCTGEASRSVKSQGVSLSRLAVVSP
jgi:hypothetical protein